MAEETRDLVLDILKQIQGQISDIQTRLGRVDDRLGRVEQIVSRQRRDSAGMLVMMRSVSGDFDQRVSEVEERVRVLEERRPAG